MQGGDMGGNGNEGSAGSAETAVEAGRRFNHHRLDVYEAAIEFVRWRARSLRRLSRTSDLADQITRASTSIALNIAEACGEGSFGEQARFFRIARRSATECDAILDVIEALGLETPERVAEGRTLLGRMIAMLTALSRVNSAS